MSTPSLDALLARARTTEVRAELAAARVGELDRWVREDATRRARWLSFGVGLAAAAAVALVVGWWLWPGGELSPILIGDRVAIVAEPGTRYRVAATGPDATELTVEHGAVTARLWPGPRAHRLALRGADVVATATGTIYTLAVDAAGARVSVHEGSVEVSYAGGQRAVGAGATWAARGDRAQIGSAAATRLLALTAPVTGRDEAPEDAGQPVAVLEGGALDEAVADAGADAAIDAGADAAAAPRDATAAVADTAPSPTERWRTVRLLRAQNKLDAALAECLALADLRDATWSPIALVEAIQIELGPRASPERAIALADRAIAEWPAHTLAAEARTLRCRALRQLGRGGECAPPASDAGAPPASDAGAPRSGDAGAP